MRSTAKKSLAPTLLGEPLRPKVGTTTGWALGGRHAARLTKKDVTVILRNLATLTSNGVSLPKAIGALADEKSLEKRRDTLKQLRGRVESGELVIREESAGRALSTSLFSRWVAA